MKIRVLYESGGAKEFECDDYELNTALETGVISCVTLTKHGKPVAVINGKFFADLEVLEGEPLKYVEGAPQMN